NGAKANYKEAGDVLESLLYRAKEKQPEEKRRIQDLAAKDRERLKRMSLKKPSSLDELEEVEHEEDIRVEESGEVESEIQEGTLKVDGLKLSQNKYSKITKSFCSIFVVLAIGILMKQFLKYNA
ncbi:MAG: hypothetical protein KR126chlam5_00891, partial [Candidatus Anoxychlamydiales bacterium]|nr:hypothetical protein [Candidatus Anoxychlamydiales bacterium]